jgi:hypothetical protein
LHVLFYILILGVIALSGFPEAWRQTREGIIEDAPQTLDRKFALGARGLEEKKAHINKRLTSKLDRHIIGQR